jgi:hypothetical protein
MTATPKPFNTASLAVNTYCKNCGWPVIHVCCNDGMSVQEPYKSADWWGYCSNKTCENHAGREWGQSDPEFIFRVTEE